MFMQKSFFTAAAATLALVFGATFATDAEAGKKARKAPARSPNLVEVASAANASGPYAGQFDTLLAAVGAADPIVGAALSSGGQLTVFAPTDDAFDALFAELAPITPEQLIADKQLLTNVLLYHVAPGRRNSNAVVGSSQIRMMVSGFVYQDGGKLIDNNGREVGFVVTDIPASNGVIHVIDRVLLP
ncbi:MAG: fasciclin protein [Proteobacteria bacterium]|nr:fasciclin protein [Pseudomonadota bacterium]